ncbi:MAG: flagellar export protein FliJ [Acidimicrobiales bacterium]
MKRYRFRLDTVLRVRRVEEERAIAELSQAQREKQRTQEIQLARLEAYNNMAPSDGSQPTTTFLANRAHLELGAASVVTAGAAHEVAELQVDECRDNWAEAAGRVTSLENLDERHRTEYLFEVNKAETAAIDDLTSARYGRAR